MPIPLRVLMVEDDEADAALVLRQLAVSGYGPDAVRVDDEGSLRTALSDETWDVVLCDWTLPGFGAMQALQIVNESGFDLPFIVVSGTVAESSAVDAMVAGARDYIFKGQLARLAPAIERELRERDQRAARHRAEQASRAKTDFLSSMSHELRTPLNAILGFAQLLKKDKREPLTARQSERVAQILSGGDHLLRLIEDILDLSRIEAGGLAVSLEPVSVPSVLSDVMTTLEPLAAHHGVVTRVEAFPADLVTVSADRTRFAQILMNFGSNSIKYNRPAGTVTFGVSMPTLDCIRVTVTDTGMGIAADKQDKLFQPFQRAGQETGPIEGSGIGLVVTKRLAELMHGRVGFQSTEGEGSQFWVELPVH